MLKKCIKLVIIGLVLIVLFHPGRHAKYYDYINVSDIFKELVQIENTNQQHNLKLCSQMLYANIILSNEDLNVGKISRTQNYTNPLDGGEFYPRTCSPIFKSAIVVPYRNRKEHLDTFLYFMHTFLQKQMIHYRIFVVEQSDEFPFNRAKMLNVGAQEAINLGFPCLILHDVDLLPVASGNIYACSNSPRHMSSSVDTFRYNLPYLTLFGGAVAIQSSQFQQINGMSNFYEGWGGEDDDFSARLESNSLKRCRFAPEISKYMMLFHKKENPSSTRYNMLDDLEKRQKTDGLNSLPNTYKVELKPLYTHILV